MQKEITLEAKGMSYTLRASRRSRAIRLAVYPDGSLVVSAPRYASESAIERFILQKSTWIERTISYFKSLPERVFIKSGRGDFARYKEAALALAMERLEHFNKVYKFSFRKVTIRNQRTRWGSCSRRGNINFNYKIALLPPALADYIILHELCHLGAFNHSSKFWALVARSMPNYLEAKRELKRTGFSL